MPPSGYREPPGYDLGVENSVKTDRATAVAAAAAHELNDELTVILTSVSNSLDCLEPDHPATVFLEDLRAAAQRCAYKSADILRFTRRRGTRPAATPLAALVE